MKRLVITVCILVILVSLLFFHTRGIIFHDGGYVLQTAERMVNPVTQNIHSGYGIKGEMIYKDFDFVYTPLSVYITAFLFKFFGQSVLIERIFSMFLSLIGISSVFYISYRVSRNIFLSFISSLIFLWWGPSHINFLSPVMLSIELSLLTIVLFLRKNFILAGIVTALTLLSKQNFGIALCITNIAFFIFSAYRDRIFLFIQYLFGSVSVFIIFFLYLILTKSFVLFIHNMYFYMFQKILVEQVLQTSLPYGKTLLITAIKFLIYLFPLIISITGIILSYKKYRKFLFLFIFVIAFYALGIRPETDYVHLTPLLSLTGIPLIILWKSTKTNASRITLGISCIVMLTGLYTALFNNYYRWEMPLIKDNYYISESNMHIWLDPKEYFTLQFFRININQFSKPNEYIYVDLHAPFIYFYAKRKNPIRYYYAQHYATGKREQQEIINDLRVKNVRLIIANQSYSQKATAIDDFISQNFHSVGVHNEYIILLKN